MSENCAACYVSYRVAIAFLSYARTLPSSMLIDAVLSEHMCVDLAFPAGVYIGVETHLMNRRGSQGSGTDRLALRSSRSPGQVDSEAIVSGGNPCCQTRHKSSCPGFPEDVCWPG